MLHSLNGSPSLCNRSQRTGELIKLHDLFVIVPGLHWRSQCDITQVLTSFHGTSCQAEGISQKIPLGDHIKDADPTLLITCDQVKVLFFVNIYLTNSFTVDICCVYNIRSAHKFAY